MSPPTHRAEPGTSVASPVGLLERLGLDTTATPEEIEAAHRTIVDFLASAPRDLRPWARYETDRVDAAFALLINPAAVTEPDALEDPERAAVQPGGPATPPARRAPAPDPTSGPDGPIDVATDDLAEDDLTAAVSPDAHPDTIGADRPARSPRTGTAAAPRRRPRLPRLVTAGLVVAGLAAVLVVGYNLGAPDGQAGGSGSPTATPVGGLDQARVASLMSRVQANPQDTEALFGLADAFFAANDFVTAESWLNKVLAIDSRNVRALVALGAARFNTGDTETARQKWLAALEIDPNNVEAYYDLGFLYYSANPPDLEGVRREWGKVVELAPGTQLASTVEAHLGALTDGGPSGSPAATGSPAAPASPAPSTSAEPSGSTAP